MGKKEEKKYKEKEEDNQVNLHGEGDLRKEKNLEKEFRRQWSSTFDQIKKAAKGTTAKRRLPKREM